MEYIIIIVSILLVAAIILIIVGAFKYKKDKEKWSIEAEDSFKRGKEEAADFIRMTMDKVQEDKTKLEAMSEKELLVETMLVLGGYGRRLDRMEEKMQSLINYKAYSEEMNKQINILTGSSVSLQNSISEVGNYVTSVKQMLQEATSSVRGLNNSLGDVGNVANRVEALSDTLNGLLQDLDMIKTETSHIVKGMYDLFNSYGEGPGQRLQDIDENVSGIKSSMENVEELIESVRYTVDGINGDVESIKSTVTGVDEIKSIVQSNLDSCGYDSIHTKVDDISSEISSIKSRVEESLDKFGYDSLYNKIEELRRD
ncbi:MAG: hypothetical protein E7292_07890 [Lachnospiraceae bacterium]|nr:hypothetical protein [Lachnospiraceae bacterium]